MLRRRFIQKTRLYSAITANNKINKLKRIEDIPTLKQFPIIGHSYLFFPGAKYQLERLTEAVEDISAKLGTIFKLNLGGTNLIVSTDADHTEALFRNEGKYPIRPAFPALLHYRRVNYGSVGVVPGNGEEWYKYRQGVMPLLKANLVRSYRQKHEEIADNFVEYIDKNMNRMLILEDVFTHLLKYTIEAISVVSPGHHFQCLSNYNNNNNNNNKEDIIDIITASIDFMDGLHRTFTGLPIWKYYKTVGYRKLETSHKTIHKIVEKHLKELDKDKPEIIQTTNSYMHSLFSNTSYNWNDKLMLSMETFLGGIDATATTIAVTLHYLAHNKDVQDLARSECIQDNTRLPYLRACVKESLRMCPTGGANSRVTIADTNIGGYLIPKHTLVLPFSSVTSNKPEYFDKPGVYRPERWLRDSNCNVHPFASLPFGFGARMCPGRRIAEQEIVVLLMKVSIVANILSLLLVSCITDMIGI
ncbi:cytochrome p450 family 4 [Holotrichia oblita]|uniref:Cytochrome p450 family 4 n=1 Tax=Holotrichia oblita TaxID=644536 RepID=A0ACB9TRE1_HOLOL|nr:cytochrome p450 family 4 [Holotrichia oblita]